MTQITTHVLDTSHGRPAAGIAVLLERQAEDESWRTVWRGKTDYDGRIRNVLEFEGPQLAAGIFRLHFETEAYFRSFNIQSFYPYVEVIFNVDDPSQHYHVPLLLSPFTYSTYRGS
jgi:5-hydroxyisourate hydrolase